MSQILLNVLNYMGVINFDRIEVINCEKKASTNLVNEGYYAGGSYLKSFNIHVLSTREWLSVTTDATPEGNI